MAHRRRHGVTGNRNIPARARSPASDAWGTPQWFFDERNAEFGPFTLDVCALPENAKCADYFTPADDGLKQPWHGVCWMNPPYTRGEVPKWLAKATQEVKTRGVTVVALIPARPCTKWWRDYVEPAYWRFVPGRLKFVAADGTAQDPARFGSAVVVMRP
jgi:phage N-6-adenine-methyltransferase